MVNLVDPQTWKTSHRPINTLMETSNDSFLYSLNLLMYSPTGTGLNALTRSNVNDKCISIVTLTSLSLPHRLHCR